MCIVVWRFQYYHVGSSFAIFGVTYVLYLNKMPFRVSHLSTGIKQRLHISQTNKVARDRLGIARLGAPQSSPRGARLQHAEVLIYQLVRAFHAQALFPDGVGEPLVDR